MKKVILYGRVSTTKQVEKGISLPAQDEILYKYATEYLKYQDEDISVLKDEGISGGTIDKRPALQKIIEAIKANKKTKAIHYILIYNIRRLSRNTIDLLSIAELARKNHVKIYSIAEGMDITDEDNEMSSTIHAMIAQKERKDGAKTIKFALNYKKENSLVYGTLPYGFSKRKGKMFLNEQETPIVKAVFQKKDQNKGVRVIAREMNEENYKPRKAKAWQPSTIERILKNREYYKKHSLI